ncbi:glycosyltransferase family 4 protein [Pseudovibrio flavus]|uniref:glycosyltransferase family 4 protein n=1 Tax=Pseudovibrio flavus TaxID=2529854 RepID=UPI00211C3F25|nr:glycosyltransferase family 4 protein [Pseudovibrio flavus]
MKVLNYLPRNMHFGPQKATSIDLCVYQQSLKSEHEVLVVCDEIEEPFKGIPVRMLKKGSRGERLRQLEEIVSKFQPDLIVVQQHGPTAHKVAGLFNYVPVLLHRHNFENDYKLSWFKTWRHRRRYQGLQGLIFVSETCKNAFEALHPNLNLPLYTVFNGIDSSLWQHDKEKKNKVIFVGRIEPHKNALPAAQAMAKFLSLMPDWSASLIGPFSGPEDYVSRVKEVVDSCDRLFLEKELPHEEIKMRLEESKISLICSESESFCLVAIESFAAGSAVVSTANGALPETIGNAGIFLRNLNVDEITASLLEMVENTACYADLGRQKVRNYDLKTTAKRLDEVYRKSKA